MTPKYCCPRCGKFYGEETEEGWRTRACEECAKRLVGFAVRLSQVFSRRGRSSQGDGMLWRNSETETGEELRSTR